MRRALATIAILCWCSTAAPALAWWNAGHAIIADMAESRLTPAAKRHVQGLLALEQHRRLRSIASWADNIRRDRPETSNWHFVDIPLDAAGYDARRDCPRDNCVVAQIDRFARVLADRTADPAVRLEALKFVVHFVGDVHQPLHCEDHRDRGGNDVRVRWFGKPANLHMVWDGLIIERMGSATALRKRLADSISKDEARQWSATTPAEWANEGHALAREIAYGRLPAGAQPVLGEDYLHAAEPVVAVQLERGGVRLAHVLNDALR